MSKTREYIKEKNIELLFEELMRHVINEKPDNPVTYLIEVLQKKGEVLVIKKSKDGPRISQRNQRNNISCSGTAIDIRASLERVLPRACESTPVKLGIDNERSRSAPPDNTVVTKPKEEKSISPTEEQETGDVVVTQDYVQNVQSIFDFSWGKKKKKESEVEEKSKEGKKDKTDKSKKKKKKKKKSGSDSESSADEKGEDDENEKIIDVKIKKEKKSKNEEEKETDIKEVINEEAPVENEEVVEETEEPTKDQDEEEVADGPTEEEPTEEEPTEENEENEETVEDNKDTPDDLSVMMTASCDLTELASWRDGELYEESLMGTAAAQVEESSFRNVQSAAPPLNIISSQAEDLILSDEICTTLRRQLSKPASYNTMFFEDPDTDMIPSVEEVSKHVPVFSAPKIEKKQEPYRKPKRSDSDELSISDFSACPWSYAESIS